MSQINISLPPNTGNIDFDNWANQTTQYLRDGLGFSNGSTLVSNTTITDSLVMKQGSMYVIPSGVTLTINGSFEAGQYQVFSGDGTVKFGYGSVPFVSPCWFGFSYGTNDAAQAVINKSAITKSIASFTTIGGKIQIPQGSFKCDPNITINRDHITISGSGSADEYGSYGTAASRLVFTTGTIGIDATYIDTAVAGSYCFIENICVDGGGVLNCGIKIDGKVQLSHVSAVSCLNAGIQMTGAVNQSRLENVSLIANTGGTGYGLLIDDDGTYNNTIMHFSNLTVRQNTVGIRLTNGKLVTFKDSVIESNTTEGLQIYKPTGGSLESITFENVWFENNNAGTTNYQVTITAQSPDLNTGAVHNVTFDRCFFASFANERSLAAIATRYLKLNQITSIAAGAGAAAFLIDTNAYATEIYNIVSSAGYGAYANCVTDYGTLTYTSYDFLSAQYPSVPGGRFNSLIYGDTLISGLSILNKSGQNYSSISSNGNVTQGLHKITITYEGFKAAALTGDVLVTNIPAKTKITGVIADTTTKYLGGAISAAAMVLGIVSNGDDKLIKSHDVFTAAVTKGLLDADMGTSMAASALVQGGCIPSWTGTTNVYARITSVTANTSALTQGSTTFYIMTERF